MKTYSNTLKTILARRLPLAFFMVLAGCDSSFTPPPVDNTAVSSLSAYNFSSEGIQEYFIDGSWGGGVGIGSGGGQVCCVKIPRKWHDKLEVTVEWRRSDCGVPKSPQCSHENAVSGSWPMKTLKKKFAIEPYSAPDTVQVFFLPHDEIKIYVSDMSPGHQDHPSKLGRARPISEEEFQRFMKK